MKDSQNKISINKIHETYWRCRDFELSHLWQRSIFLSAFLILCFTGYGTIILKFVDLTTDITYINLLALIISAIGIIFSCLWIMMGKGSKAWYERYESAISAFERNNEYTTKQASEIGGFQYEEIDNYKQPVIRQSILNGSGGAFSPSKINIAIGQITMIIWMCAFLIHSLVVFLGYNLLLGCGAKYVVWGAVCVGIAIFLFLVFRQKWLFSSTLNNE